MSRPSPQTGRLIDLVDLLAGRPDGGFTLAEISRALDLGKSTIHPMLVELARRGWLLRDPERHAYRLGPALVAAGRVAERGHPVVDAARPYVREVAERTGLTCLALVASSVPAEYDDLLVGEVGQPSAGTAPGPAARPERASYQGLRLGNRVRPQPPLGAVCVAWSDDPRAVDRWLDRLGPDRPQDALSQVMPGLAGVRERGWALETDNSLRERLATLAVELSEDGRNAEHAAALRRMMSEIGRAFDLADTLPPTIEPDALYRPSAVNAPVFDARGAVTVVLCVVCKSDVAATPPWRGAEILDLGKQIRAAADAVTVKTGGRAPASRPAL